MAYNFFLSHYTKDKEVAEIIATTLSRISLRQITPWFSSDSSESGGLKPGNIWFNEILKKIQQSKALVALLTPNSIGRPWIYFESGIAQSLDNCEIIPVCVGTKRDTILPPLGMYQCYQLTDYGSLKEFIGKLLTKFEISFDEEMSKPVLEKAISDLSKINFKIDESNNHTTDFNQTITDLKSHIDKRFIELLDNHYTINVAENKFELNNKIGKESDIIYSITVEINFPEYQGRHYLEIRIDDNVQDVLNDIYYLINDYVDVWTYMEQWVLENPKTQQKLIIREVAKMIPAKYLFKPEIEWRAIKIKHQYKAIDSKEIVSNV